ncbi:hypothetical protein ENBRE01_1213 [Enteropsectra breve]|nr:hypothetical protein ENBRE01_1213 [Enteropsectra breve]
MSSLDKNACDKHTGDKNDKSKCTGLSKGPITLSLPIPHSIPKSEIKLNKTETGYRINVDHHNKRKEENSVYESHFTYSHEECFGRPVHDVSGDFNGSGSYEVKVVFDDENE